MKNKFIQIITFFILALSVVIAGCANSPTGDDEIDDNNNNGNLVSRSIKLNDGNGNFIGYVVNVSKSSLNIYTNKNYFVTMDWKANISKSTVYFTDTDGKGTMFSLDYSNNIDSFLGNSVIYYDNKLYIPDTLDADGFIISDESITD